MALTPAITSTGLDALFELFAATRTPTSVVAAPIPPTIDPRKLSV